MRRVPLVLAVLLALKTQAFATWSVIAVDRKTGEIGMASATCVSQGALMRFPALSLKDTLPISSSPEEMIRWVADSTTANLMQIEVTDNIQPNENDNPVKTLRMRYDRWRRSKSGGRVSGR